MMGTMREKYINAIFLAHCIAFGFTPYFLGAFDKYGYRAMPTKEEIERFRDRRHGETGRLLRRQQKNNQPYLYGGVTSFHPSMNFRLAEYACANGKAGMERINRAMYLSHLAAYQAVAMKGVEVATGAGGKNVMSGLPLWLQVTHAVNHDGTPGFHTHRLSAGNATDAQGVPRVVRNKEIFYAQDRAYNVAFQASFAHHAKTLLGMRHVEFNGTHAVDKTVDPRMARAIGIGERQDRIQKWMAERNWDYVKNGTLIPNMATRQKETKQYTLEDRLADWTPKVEKAIRDQEQRTGRAWDRVPRLDQKQEPTGAAAAVGAKVEEPKQSAKIDLNTYSQPKAEQAKAEQAKEEPKAEAKQEPPKWQAVAPGTVLMANDVTPANYGRAVADLGDRVKMHFVNPETGKEATPTIGKEKLAFPDGRTLRAEEKGQKAERGQEAKQEAKTGPKESRERRFKESTRRMYEAGLELKFIARLRRDVKTRIKTFMLLRASREMAGRDKHVIATREGMKQFLFDARERPRWYARQQAHRAIRRNIFKMTPHDLAAHAQDIFREARRPTIALKRHDRIQVSKAVAAELTRTELNALVEIARKSKAKLFIPGRKAEVIAAAKAQQKQQKQQKQKRGQTHFH